MKVEEIKEGDLVQCDPKYFEMPIGGEHTTPSELMELNLPYEVTKVYSTYSGSMRVRIKGIKYPFDPKHFIKSTQHS